MSTSKKDQILNSLKSVENTSNYTNMKFEAGMVKLKESNDTWKQVNALLLAFFIESGLVEGSLDDIIVRSTKYDDPSYFVSTQKAEEVKAELIKLLETMSE